MLQQVRSKAAARGYVYVFGNACFEPLKIGATTRDPQIRALELSAPTGVPGGYDILLAEFVPHPFVVEQKVHSLLDGYRLAPNKEFFLCSVEEALRVVRGCVEEARAMWGGVK